MSDLIDQVLGDPLFYPAVFKNWLPRYLEVNSPNLTAASILGFTGYLGQQARVTTSQTTASTTYADLGTVGPQLSQLGNGSWVFLYGAIVTAGAASQAYVSLSANGSTPVDTDAAENATASAISVIGFTVQTLSSNTNTVKLQYRSAGGGTSTFANRWLLGFKLSN